MSGTNEVSRPIAVGAARSDSERSIDLNLFDSTSWYPVPPSFRRLQYLEAQGMPRVATEPTTACVMGVRLSMLRRLRMDGTGPRFRMDEQGRAVYARADVLAFMRSHVREGEL